MAPSEKLDRRSTILLQASRPHTQSANETSSAAVEDPGIGGFFGKVGRFFRGRDSTTSGALDRRSTILLQAARSPTQSVDEEPLSTVEDPGINALRGKFGSSRARQQAHWRSRGLEIGVESTEAYDPTGFSDQAQVGNEIQGLPPTDPQLGGLKRTKRYQLYDNPVPNLEDDSDTWSLAMNSTSPRPTSIKFDSQDVVHQYYRPGTGDNRATHEHRTAHSSPGPPATQEDEPQVPKLPPLGLPTEGVLLQLDSPEQSHDFREEAASSTFSPQFQQTQAGDSESWRSGAVWDDEELEPWQKQLAETFDHTRAVGEGYPTASSVDDAEESQRLFRRQSGGRGSELHEDIEIQATLNSVSDLQLKSEQEEKTSEQNPTTDLTENNENLLVRGGLDNVAGDTTSRKGVVPTKSEGIDQKVDFDIQAIWRFFFILTLLILMYFARE